MLIAKGNMEKQKGGHESNQESNEFKSNTEKTIERCSQMIANMNATLEKHYFDGCGGTLNMAIKGLYYRNPIDIEEARKLYIGCEVFLKEDVSNSVDTNAVAVFTNKGNHIGYVPKEYAEGIKKLLIEGLDLSCFITKKTGDDIPYLYMDVTYKSKKRIQFERYMEESLSERLKRMEWDESRDVRWKYNTIRPIERSFKTIDIKIKYDDGRFVITETVELSNGEKQNMHYFYEDNFGMKFYEEARICENSNDIVGAITLYEKNLDIEECITKSAQRLSVLYKKANRYKDIIPMLDVSIEKEKKYKNKCGVETLTQRKEKLMSSIGFIKKISTQ